MHAHHHHKPAPFQAPVVRLDGEEIPAAEIAAEMQHHPASDGAQAWRKAAEALVIRRLLVAEARRQGIAPAPEAEETEEEALVRHLLDAEVQVPQADEATCRRWFEANRARFRTSPAWQAGHVLLAADPADAAARGAARARAEAVLAEVKADPARLPDIARQVSDCPSRAEGGALGLLTRGSTVPEFEAALMETAAGEVCPRVVESRYGFHVLRVIARAEGRDLPYEQAKPRVAEYLEDAAFRRAAHQYMALLASRARVEGIALSAGADGPLVQ